MSCLAIVVPVYNVEQYLDECIKSILHQEYTDFSVILVDDGSTDSSGKKCDDWAEKDKRVKTYHKKNGGLMSAWKYGVVNSESAYVGFVDSDDWIEPNMYSVMVEEAEKQNADIVTCGLIADYEGKNESKREQILLPSGVYEKSDIEEKIYPILLSGRSYSTRGFSPNRVTKVFKRELLEECLSNCNEDVSIGEDLLTTFYCLQNAKRVVIKSGFFPYHYRINQASMIRNYSDSKYEKIDILYQNMLDANKQSKYDFSEQIHTDYIKLVIMQLDSEILFSGKNVRQLIKRMKEISRTSNFCNAVAHSEYTKLPIKYKIYLWSFRYRIYGLALMMRKVKRS